MDNKFYISYINEDVKEMYKDGGVKTKNSAGFDCITIENVVLRKGEFTLINLGIIIKPPKNLFTILVPRSSTFKKFKIIQTNSIGIIDSDYCGKNDIVKMPVLAMEDTTIPKGTRIAQLVLMDNHIQNIIIDTNYNPNEDSRGGFGSTG